VSDNPFDLGGKVVLVSGANAGLGLAWADAAAAAGADVVIWGRRKDANEAARRRLERHGGRVLAQAVDVSDEELVIDAAREALEALGRIDGAIINAGINRIGPGLRGLSTAEWREILDVNLDGSFYTLREVSRHMVDRFEEGDGGGSIITCGSLSITDGVPLVEAYAASKGALASLTKSMAVELAGRGIRVNMILPGRIATDLAGSTPAEKEADRERARVIPAGRLGTPQDCAGIGVYLLSDASAYHTGDLIKVDGGLSIRLP
jgi:NAD(P)-dependent dehydrogenase (short-subunit alcohol dehydrogenase family)